MSAPAPAWAPPGGRKSDRTRAAIVSAAMELFRERGYDATTMRDIARSADLSLGCAYYYFRSKDELVAGCYGRLAVEHAAAAEPVLAVAEDFERGLHGVLRCWLEIAEPFHPFAGRFFSVVAQPDAVLSGADATEARDAGIGLYTRLVAGFAPGGEPRLYPHLPELLWRYHLGVVLFWVHDRSPGLGRTSLLVDRTVPMVSRLIQLSRSRVLRPLSGRAADLLGALRG
ncbi:MAG: TetR family transcriptional regulator [Pseudonocardiaceae bacterium]